MPDPNQPEPIKVQAIRRDTDPPTIQFVGEIPAVIVVGINYTRIVLPPEQYDEPTGMDALRWLADQERRKAS